MEKVDLIKDRCIGCGACMSIAPENFTFGDDGRAEIISNEINDAAIEASEMCPVSAITIEGNCECESCECGCNTENDKDCDCQNECSCEENCTCTEEDNCGCLDNCNCNKDCNCGCNN